MVDPFSVTSGGLKPHWNTLMTELAAHLDPRTSRVALIPTVVGNQIITSFAGDVVRLAGRNRGNPTPVAPLRAVGRDWEVWLGYREVWTLLTGVERFVFSSADLTIFFAIAQSEDFQQILRAEWTGQSKDVDGWSFKPSDAGHPHWQIDAIEVFRQDRDAALCSALLDQELATLRDTAAMNSRYDDAASLFRELIEAPTFPEFLTLPAYEMITAESLQVAAG